MSWSFYVTDTKEEIVRKLNEESGRLSGQSKEEFDAAKDHLISLVEGNVQKDQKLKIRVEASGHAYIKDGEVQSSTVNVLIQNLGVVKEEALT